MNCTYCPPGSKQTCKQWNEDARHVLLWMIRLLKPGFIFECRRCLSVQFFKPLENMFSFWPQPVICKWSLLCHFNRTVPLVVRWCQLIYHIHSIIHKIAFTIIIFFNWLNGEFSLCYSFWVLSSCGFHAKKWL